jgi:glucose dehydrogenase
LTNPAPGTSIDPIPCKEDRFMQRLHRRFSLCAYLFTFVVTGIAHAQTGVTDGNWPYFGGDSGSTKDSSLAQINSKNFAALEIKWRWQSIDGRFDIEQLRIEYPNLQVPNDVPEVGINALKAAPLAINEVLYISTPLYQAAALDARSGTTLWTYDPRSYASGIPVMMLGSL